MLYCAHRPSVLADIESIQSPACGPLSVMTQEPVILGASPGG